MPVAPRDDNPAALADHDPQWLTRAAQLLEQVRAALAGLPGAAEAELDHIGSTSVPGLAAKPFLDLQVRILPLPSDVELSARLEPLGFRRAQGARPDSPGVYRDMPRGEERVPDEVWEKSLFFSADEPAILHIRRADSPWGRYTVWFRDWLRANPDARRRYEMTKRELSQANTGKADYDDYTRAKTAFFDDVQAAFSTWANAARDPGVCSGHD
jgi:dephospho-CoA kinase